MSKEVASSLKVRSRVKFDQEQVLPEPLSHLLSLPEEAARCLNLLLEVDRGVNPVPVL